MNRCGQGALSIELVWPCGPIPSPSLSPVGSSLLRRELPTGLSQSHAICVESLGFHPPLRGHPSTRGEACHWIFARLRLTTNPVPLPPLTRSPDRLRDESVSLHSQSPAAPYECSSLRTGEQGERCSPTTLTNHSHIWARQQPGPTEKGRHIICLPSQIQKLTLYSFSK